MFLMHLSRLTLPSRLVLQSSSACGNKLAVAREFLPLLSFSNMFFLPLRRVRNFLTVHLFASTLWGYIHRIVTKQRRVFDFYLFVVFICS
jgi:hypothetical protein